jgi:exoribonuclease R
VNQYNVLKESGMVRTFWKRQINLNNADLVKFAKFNPIASVNEEMMIQAKEIVNHTIPKVREAEGQNV